MESSAEGWRPISYIPQNTMFSLPFLFPKTTFSGDHSTVPEIKDYSCYRNCYGGMASPFSIHGSLRMEKIKISNKQKTFCSIGRLQRRRRRKNSVICFQNLNFGFNNVTETLHDLSARLIKAENVSLLTNYLKKRNEGTDHTLMHYFLVFFTRGIEMKVLLYKKRVYLFNFGGNEFAMINPKIWIFWYRLTRILLIDTWLARKPF